MAARLEPLEELHHPGVVEAGKRLGFAAQGEVRVAGPAKREEFLLVHDLDGVLLAGRRPDPQTHVAEPATAEDCAQVPHIANHRFRYQPLPCLASLRMHDRLRCGEVVLASSGPVSFVAPRCPHLAWCSCCCPGSAPARRRLRRISLCSRPGGGSDPSLQRALVSGLGNLEREGRERFLPRLVRVHAQGEMVPMPKPAFETLSQAMLVDETIVRRELVHHVARS
mmetsp:Transcript_65138/g.187460  ORF Transcript_65138/g.187460 Transcript_65138/m.187460 type:complete len:224 (-) Transcript_65138:171-842(-)